MLQETMTNGEEEKGTEAEEPQAAAEDKVMHSSFVCPLRNHVCYNVRNFQSPASNDVYPQGRNLIQKHIPRKYISRSFCLFLAPVRTSTKRTNKR
jgi:hypothetical protein